MNPLPSNDTPAAATGDENFRLAEAILYYLTALDAGQEPEMKVLLDRFADVKAELQEFIAADRRRRPDRRRQPPEVARAIQHAHERGIIHRGLKPGKILLDRLGRPYVVGFGLARGPSGSITESVTVGPGILHYMSPEQVRGERGQFPPPAPSWPPPRPVQLHACLRTF